MSPSTRARDDVIARIVAENVAAAPRPSDCPPEQLEELRRLTAPLYRAAAERAREADAA